MTTMGSLSTLSLSSHIVLAIGPNQAAALASTEDLL